MKPTIRCLLMSFIGAGIYLYSCTKDHDISFKSTRCIEGAGNIVSKNVNISQFCEVELKSYGNVKIYKGDQLSVSISDYNNLIDYHKVEISGNKLVIRTEPTDLCFSNSKATFIITTPGPLNTVYLNGCGNIDLMSEFDKLQQLSITGSGNITLHADIATDKLDILISGAGDINAKGSTTDLTVNVFGAGNVYLKNMLAQNATCNIAGTGQIVVHAVSSLNASIKGVGNIEYSGNPKLKSSISGIGKIKCISEN